MSTVTKFYNIGEYNGWSWLGDNGVPRVDVVATAGNDWYQIGNAYDFHHGALAKDINKRHNRGNIGALAGQGETTIDMGDGDDRIDTGVNAYNGKPDWSATADAGNIWGNAIVKMGSGNDVLNVGKPHDYDKVPQYQTGGANIHGAKVSMGSGDDKLSVFQDVDGKARIDLGSGDDKMVVGGDIGDIIDGKNSPVIEAGSGNDEVRVAGNLWARSSIDMGEGNNYLNVREVRMWGKALFGNGNDTMDVRGNVTENAFIKMDRDVGNPTGPIDWPHEVPPPPGYGGKAFGDDTLNVAGNIDGIVRGARVDMGGGDDTLNVGKVIGGTAEVKMGSGNDIANINDGIVFRAKLDMGEGNDTLNVKNNITWKTHVDMGEGNNTVNVGGGLVDWAKMTSGSGQDTFKFDGITNNAQLSTGGGNDTVNVNHLDFYAKVDMGSGDDVLYINKTFGRGAVQDRLLLKDSGAQVDMGDGNDLVIYGGKSMTGVINGGAGKDTLVLTYDADDSLVSGPNTWFKEATNLSTLNIRGIETIVMDGKNAVDIKYEDLLADTTREGALFIRGNSTSKVDLGATDWNSDTDTWLKEYTPLDLLNVTGKGEWAKTGSKVVDGISYDVYHHSFAGSDTQNDVYIQQGVMVI